MSRPVPSMHRAVDVALRTWFLASVWLGVLFVGWGVFWLKNDVIAVCGIAAFALVCVALFARNSNRSWARALLGSAHLISAFVTGGVLSVTDAFDANTWMDGSMRQVVSDLKPVTHFDGTGASVTVDEEKRDALERKFQGMKLANFEDPMLVSFDEGLALVKDDGVHFLTDKGVLLSLSALFPDNSFIYFDKHKLIRASVKDGVLYKHWEREMAGTYLHHWGDTFDGKIYYPVKKFAPLQAKLEGAVLSNDLPCLPKGSVREDRINIYDAETGHLIDTIEMLPIVLQSPELSENLVNCSDPLHENDVEIVKTPKEAKAFPDGKVGDILVSLREINSVVLLDRDTHELKWHVSNLTTRQHSPRITDHGTIVVFDNRGSDEANGISRVSEIDIRKRKLLGYWEASGDQHFGALHRGKLLPMAHKLVVQEQPYDERRYPQMFTLECPRNIVSMKCEYTPMIVGGSVRTRYDNALPLPEEE